MRTDNGYRYSIIFSGDTEERIRVGEFLETCGHKKSAIIVEAMCAYLENNPDMPERLGRDSGISVVVKQSLTRQEIEAIVMETIKKTGMVAPTGNANTSLHGNEAPTMENQEHVNKMVDALTDLFG